MLLYSALAVFSSPCQGFSLAALASSSSLPRRRGKGSLVPLSAPSSLGLWYVRAYVRGTSSQPAAHCYMYVLWQHMVEPLLKGNKKSPLHCMGQVRKCILIREASLFQMLICTQKCLLHTYDVTIGKFIYTGCVTIVMLHGPSGN